MDTLTTEPAHGTRARFYLHIRNLAKGIDDPVCATCRTGRSKADYETELVRLKHPWNRIVNAAVRRKRYGRRELSFPLKGSRQKDVALLIKHCEDNAKNIYERMPKEFKEMVDHTIAEVPMTAEEAILAVRDHVRLSV